MASDVKRTHVAERSAATYPSVPPREEFTGLPSAERTETIRRASGSGTSRWGTKRANSKAANQLDFRLTTCERPCQVSCRHDLSTKPSRASKSCGVSATLLAVAFALVSPKRCKVHAWNDFAQTGLGPPAAFGRRIGRRRTTPMPTHPAGRGFGGRRRLLPRTSPDGRALLRRAPLTTTRRSPLGQKAQHSRDSAPRKARRPRGRRRDLRQVSGAARPRGNRRPHVLLRPNLDRSVSHLASYGNADQHQRYLPASTRGECIARLRPHRAGRRLEPAGDDEHLSSRRRSLSA
jgi:hypothetical protein